MKKDVHPKWYPKATITCTCGNTFTTGSTLPEIKIDICSLCHPFFTGEMRYVDTLGRVERFLKKQDATKGTKYLKKSLRKKLKMKDEKKVEGPSTLKEMMKVELAKKKISPSPTKNQKSNNTSKQDEE